MDLNLFADNLECRNGIWYSKSTSSISYPHEGNETCYQMEEKSFWFRHRNNCIAEVVKKFHKRSPFFDIGGGNGFVTQHLEKEGIETVLIEPGETGIKYALKRGIKNLVCATLEDAGMKKKSIPSAGLFDVVEHIREDIAFLKNIHDYLVTDGHIFITVPAYRSLWSGEDDLAGHYQRYTLTRLKKTLAASGFEVVYDTYFFSILPLPIFLFRMIPDKLAKRKKSLEADKYKTEHLERKGIAGSVLNRIWDWELGRIKKLGKIPAGGSCLVAARKI